MQSVYHLLFLFALTYGYCPPGTVYESYFNKCYKLVTQPLSFLTAEQQCISIGGHLATISNAFENSFVSSFVAQNTSAPTYWIGANWLMTSSWTWSSGDNFTYSNWGIGQPIDPNAYQCAAVQTADNTWLKQFCNSRKPFVCNIDPNVVAPTSCPPLPTPTPQPTGCPSNAACPKGYSLFVGDCTCIKFFSSQGDFADQLAMCHKQNGTLAMPKTAAKNTFMFTLDAHPSNFPWIGLTCLTDSKKDCNWVDGTPLSGYSNFASNWDRGYYTYFGKDGTWYTDTITGTGSAFCEKEATITSLLIEENKEYAGKGSPSSRSN